jgi:hypothetical protein
MSRARFWGATAVIGAACLLAPVAHSQPNKAATKPAPKLEPVAETKLLMEALADPNFKGLGKLLAEKPKDDEAWRFARGQALLVAETGNLLMMRPPKARDAQDNWMAKATELREAAAGLARAAGARDYLKSRAGVAQVANACNRCHQAFKVAARVAPFPDGP